MGPCVLASELVWADLCVRGKVKVLDHSLGLLMPRASGEGVQKKKSTVLPADVETWPLSAMVRLGDVFVASVATCTDTGLLLSPNLELREQRFSAHLWSFHPAFVSSQLFPHKPSLTPSLSSCPSHSSPLFNTAPVSCFLLLEEAPCSPGPCSPQPCSPSHNNVTAQCPDP